MGRQTTKTEINGVTTRPWVVGLDVVEHQARLACLILYKACHLVAGYYDIDASALERWANSVPSTWFNEELGAGTPEEAT